MTEPLVTRMRRYAVDLDDGYGDLMREAARALERVGGELDEAKNKLYQLSGALEEGQATITQLLKENAELRKYVENVVANVLRDLKEHYRKSAIPKWDIQFLEKYAQEKGVEL